MSSEELFDGTEKVVVRHGCSDYRVLLVSTKWGRLLHFAKLTDPHWRVESKAGRGWTVCGQWAVKKRERVVMNPKHERFNPICKSCWSIFQSRQDDEVAQPCRVEDHQDLHRGK